MIPLTITNIRLVVCFLLSLSLIIYASPASAKVTITDKGNAGSLTETADLLAHTPDSQVECFQGKSLSNVALTGALYNETLAEELSARESVDNNKYNIELNALTEHRLELYDLINIHLMAAVSGLESEILEEDRKFRTCMGGMTQDSFRAFEHVNYFYPRQVADGSAADSDWIAAMDKLAAQISQVQLNANSGISLSEIKAIDDPESHYQKARSTYLGLIKDFAGYADGYDQDMSARMQATWACGLTTSAAVAMLSWTRAPSQLATTSYEQGSESIKIINQIFHDIKAGCSAHIGGGDVESELPAIIWSYDVCNDWRHYYRNQFRACKTPDNELPDLTAANPTDTVRNEMRNFANTVELIPQTRIQLIMLYQALNNIRIEAAGKPQNDGSATTAEINNDALALEDVRRLLDSGTSMTSVFRAGCFAGIGEDGLCNGLSQLAESMITETTSKKDQEIIHFLLSYGEAVQGNITADKNKQAAMAAKELKKHKEYLTARSAEAVKSISKMVFGDERALQTLQNLNISSLVLQTRKSLDAEDLPSR